MTEFAKWAWIVVLGILFMGWDFFWFLGAGIVFALLIWWLKPEWLDKL